MSRTIFGLGVGRVNTPVDAQRPLLVVSPHLDDVVLSCFALVARPEPMTVLHACTAVPRPAVRSDWDRRSGFADSDVAHVARVGEERAAFAGTPHRFREAGVLDGQYVNGERAATDSARIGAEVKAWLDEVGSPCTVAMPIGAGCDEGALVPLARAKAKATKWQLFWAHPDHLLARDATLDAVGDRPGVDLVFYEDYPYRVTKRGTRSAGRLAARMGGPGALEAVDVAVDRGEKARRIQAYSSQLPNLFPVWSHQHDRLRRLLPRHERYWRPRT